MQIEGTIDIRSFLERTMGTAEEKRRLHVIRRDGIRQESAHDKNPGGPQHLQSVGVSPVTRTPH